MSFRVNVTISEKTLGKQIARDIDRGVKTAGNQLERDMKRVAKSRIRQRDAIWSRQLLESFESETIRSEDATYVHVWNHSPHAEYVERGARYTVKKPPLDKLLPWVAEKMGAWTLTPDPSGPLGYALKPTRAES